MAKKSKQPRYLPSSLPSGTELYKAGMYAELQKFGKTDKERQLLLSEIPGEPGDSEITGPGLNFTVSEDKAFCALQRLLARTGYEGNRPATEVPSHGYQGRFRLPGLQFTPSEYFEAYGLKQYGGRYHGTQTQEALEALKNLATTPRTILYRRVHWHGNGQSRRRLYDVIRHTGPILQIVEGYKNLEEEEAKRLEAGAELPGRVTKVTVQFGPLIVDHIETFFLLKPAKLHQEIEAYLGSKRISPSVSRFCQWLLTKNSRTVKISREDLARRLNLDYLIKQRKPTRLQEQLLECCETAQALSYLLEYKEGTFGMLFFRLNPERCKRLGQLEEAEAEPPK